jgi:hypothetical protein
MSHGRGLSTLPVKSRNTVDAPPPTHSTFTVSLITVASVKLSYVRHLSQGVSVRYFLRGHRGGGTLFSNHHQGFVRYFRTVTSVAHFRVLVSEVVFGVNFLAISLETLRRFAQQLTNLFMFLYQKWVGSQKCSHQVTLSAVHWQVAPLHQPLSPTISSVVPGVSSSPRTLFSERHFWGAVRTLTLATVHSPLSPHSPTPVTYRISKDVKRTECLDMEGLPASGSCWSQPCTRCWSSCPV